MLSLLRPSKASVFASFGLIASTLTIPSPWIRLALLAYAGEDERFFDLLVAHETSRLVEGLPREVELAAVSPDAALVFASDYMRDFATAFLPLRGSRCVPGRGCEGRPRRFCGKSSRRRASPSPSSTRLQALDLIGSTCGLHMDNPPLEIVEAHPIRPETDRGGRTPYASPGLRNRLPLPVTELFRDLELEARTIPF